MQIIKNPHQFFSLTMVRAYILQAVLMAILKRYYPSFLAIVVGFAIILSIIFLAIATASKTNAQTGANYTVEYTPSNVYAGRIPADEIHYDLSGLDSTVSYCWSLSRLSNDGLALVETFASRCQPSGSTSATIDFTLSSFFGVDNDTFGPLVVQDHFGNIIGRHFIAPVPHEDWESESPDNQTAIGNAVYLPENTEGFQHPINSSNPITTLNNDYTLLHFQYVEAAESNFIQVELWPGIGGAATNPTLSMAIELADITDYQSFGMSTTEAESLIGEQFRQSFVILNTSGDTLAFIDNTFSNATFPSGPITKFWRNPHTNQLMTGIYDYAVLDAIDGATQKVGESALAVSDRGQLWFVEHRDTVTAGLPIRVEIDASDGGIWNAYIDQNLTDGEQGLIDGTDHSFSKSTIYTYDASSTPTEDVEITYTRQADSDLFSNAIDKRFELVSTYDIVENPDALQLLQTIIEDSPMNDNIVSLLAFGILYGALVFFCALTRRCPPEVYAIGFVGMVLAFILFGLFTTFLSIMMGIFSIVVIFSMIQFRRISNV